MSVFFGLLASDWAPVRLHPTPYSAKTAVPHRHIPVPAVTQALSHAHILLRFLGLKKSRA